MEPRKCIDCGAELPEEQKRSNLCMDCAAGRMMENNKQLREKRGPFYEHWKEGLKRSLEQ